MGRLDSRIRMSGTAIWNLRKDLFICRVLDTNRVRVRVGKAAIDEHRMPNHLTQLPHHRPQFRLPRLLGQTTLATALPIKTLIILFRQH